MSEKTYVRHVKTGEVFEKWSANGLVSTTVVSKDGELKTFRTEMLTPYDPEEAWEDCRSNAFSHYHGILEVYVNDSWYPVPSPYTRTITRDGKLVVQRRRA